MAIPGLSVLTNGGLLCLTAWEDPQLGLGIGILRLMFHEVNKVGSSPQPF